MRREIITDSASFEELIQSKALYVDKTEYIQRLVSGRKKYYFISRPRRYGKSLMCSTLHALFLGKKELFENLYIGNNGYSFDTYPVYHFNFALLNTKSYESFLYDFQNMLTLQASTNGLSINIGEPSSMLQQILLQSSNKAVIIIDEFDEPVIKCLGIPDLTEKIRKDFSAFYAVIKNLGEKIRFFFLTGVTKLSNLSLFSEMNNMDDISMSPEYAAMFGYTEKEMENSFTDYIDDYIELSGENRIEFISSIRNYYDGYRFSPDADIKVYNPVSIGFFFNNNCIFRKYWEKTSSSTLAIEIAKKYDLANIMEESIPLSMSAFDKFDIGMIAQKNLKKTSVYALLYYTGYLTIKDGDADGIILGFPNIEVSSAFYEQLASLYTPASSDDAASMVFLGKRAAAEGNTSALIENIQLFYEGCSSEIIREKYENPYHLIFHMFFVASGCHIVAEDGSLKGRADDTIFAGKHIYVCELKVDSSADAALQQIMDRGYYKKYILKAKDEGMTIHLLGINFSSRKRRIEDNKEEIITF